MTRLLVDLLSYTGKKGGMETYTRELYQRLGDLRPDWEFVGFASSELAAASAPWFPGDLLDSGISGENRFTWARGELFSVGREAKRLGADLVHSPATLGPWRSPVPAVLTIHDLLYFSHPHLMNTPLYTRPVQWMERVSAKSARLIIATSETLADEIARVLSVPRDRIVVTPLAGNKSRDASKPARPRVSGHLFTGGMRRKHKNFEGLLEAMALIPVAERPALTITGSFGDDPLIPVVERLRLRQSVELKGWISDDELDDLFETSTAFIMPSLADGFALPPLEAMSMGAPALLSGNAMMREVGGDAAVYFDATDPQSIANAITSTLGDPALLAAMSRRGLERAAGFSWERVARETLAALEIALTA